MNVTAIIPRTPLRTACLSLTLALVPWAARSAAAQDAAAVADPQRSGVALVLSGGGALGLSHIGVLKALHALRVPVDCVVGTSMGALVGGIYAAGVRPEDLQQAVETTDLAAFFDDTPPRAEIAYNIKRYDYRPLFGFTLGYNDGQIQLPPGVSAGYKFELFLKEIIGTGASLSNQSFDDLPTPYRAIATDLETGAIKVFDHGELPRVMRASMSLPAIVAPTEIDGRLYVDGGIVQNLPVDVGRKLCGDHLIVVNLGTRPMSMDEITNTLDVALQSVVILTEQNVQESMSRLEPDDILIVPDLEGFTSSDFNDKDRIIELGEEAARSQGTALSSLALTPDAYDRWLSARYKRRLPAPHIAGITAISSGKISSDAIMRDIKAAEGDGFSIAELNDEIVDLYGRGDFSYVGYSIEPQTDAGSARVNIHAQSKPWGPGYLKIGLGAATDFNSPAQINLAASYRQTWMNSLGGEWQTDAQIGYNSFIKTEFMQPLQVRDGAFVAPYLGVNRTFVQFYDHRLRLGQFNVHQLAAGLDIGVTGPVGELRIGPYYSRTRGTPDFGIVTPVVPSQDISQTGLLLSGIIDQLDSYNFPRSGFFARAKIKSTREKWGSDSDYTRAQLDLTGAASFGDHTLVGYYEWGKKLTGSDDLTFSDLFNLGGLGRLSGLFLDQLSGTRYDLATLSYYRRYASLPAQIGRGLYIGFSIEAGRINDPFMESPSDWAGSGSIYWGADTILGAAHLGFGRSSLDQNTWYLVIGPRF